MVAVVGIEQPHKMSSVLHNIIQNISVLEHEFGTCFFERMKLNELLTGERGKKNETNQEPDKCGMGLFSSSLDDGRIGTARTTSRSRFQLTRLRVACPSYVIVKRMLCDV